MTRIVECVPNFSDGQNAPVIDALRASIVGVPGVQLLDVQSDPAHHRSVFTFIGGPEAVAEAAFRAIQVAAERIDLTRHRGEHPRMGAADVVPFVPVEGVSMDECVALARALGQRVGTELGIPVFLYGRAATRPDRESLPQIRKGEFEGLRERIGTDPERTPDFGPNRIHATAGCTAIGARPFLVAYNVYLDSPDVAAAEAIAKEIRTSSGGLPAVQARGFDVNGKGQVSMNLLDIDVTPPATVFAAVSAKAAARGIAVWKSEIVGLIPERAILGAGAHYIKLDGPAEAHLLEPLVRQVLGPTLDGWMDQLAGTSPTPGGGSAAALAGALAGALAAMVGRLTSSRKAYAAVAPEFEQLTREADDLRAALRRLVDDDAAAYDVVTAAYRLPKEPERAAQVRQAAIEEALLGAAAVPLQTARAVAGVARLARRAAQAGNRNAVADAGVAALLAEAAVRGAVYNVRINVTGLSDPSRGGALLAEADELEERARADAAQAAEAVRAALRPGR